MIKVDIIKNIKGVNTYENVVDTEFRELFTQPTDIPDTTPTISDFFSLYETLFYDIPIAGDNSHESLVERSQQYIGSLVIDQEKAALIEEINSLRQQIIDLSQTYLNISQLQ